MYSQVHKHWHASRLSQENFLGVYFNDVFKIGFIHSFLFVVLFRIETVKHLVINTLYKCYLYRARNVRNSQLSHTSHFHNTLRWWRLFFHSLNVYKILADQAETPNSRHFANLSNFSLTTFSLTKILSLNNHRLCNSHFNYNTFNYDINNYFIINSLLMSNSVASNLT